MLDNLNLSVMQLWYFIHAAEAGSYAGAARYLNISQSALSKSMLSLEKTIGIRLFEREGKTLTLTKAGQYLYTQWKTMLADLERSLLQAQKYPGGGKKILRIGTLDSHRAESYLRDYVNQFYALRPDCDVEIESLPTDVLKKKLLERELDLVFTVRYETEYGYWPRCTVRVIRECPQLACMLPSSPLAGSGSVTAQDLEKMRLVVISPLYLPSYDRMLRALFPDVGTAPAVTFSTVNASSQVYHLHDASDFFVCDAFHRDAGTGGLCCVPIADTHSGVSMVFGEDAHSAELDAFLSLFEAEKTSR